MKNRTLKATMTTLSALIGLSLPALAAPAPQAVMMDEHGLEFVLSSQPHVVPAATTPVRSVQTLGQASVGDTIKTFRFKVKNCAAGLTHLKLLVERAPVMFDGAGVIFTDGSTWDTSYSGRFDAGYDSGWMKVESYIPKDRCAESVYVNARSDEPGRTARATVMGTFR